MVNQGEHYRMGRGDDPLGAAGGQPHQNTRRENKKEHRNEQAHPDVHSLYFWMRFLMESKALLNSIT
jgi:hypothetical protein